MFRCDGRENCSFWRGSRGGGVGETATSSALEFWLSFQNLIPPQTLGSQLGQAVLKVGAVEPTTLH